MKIAIFHNYLDNIGGAEIVTLTTARELGADIYTTNINEKFITKMGFEDLLPNIYSIGKVLSVAPFKQQMSLWKFRWLNLGRKYDTYIIMGDWAMSAAVNHSPNMWYVHAPLNELWQFKNFVKQNMLTWWKRPLYDVWVYINRCLTVRYSKKVDCWVANSKNTKERINKFYNQDAEIIHPPIDTKAYKNSCPREIHRIEDYWLSVNRLSPHKRIEIQMKAFENLPTERLIIVGSYEKGVSQFETYKNKIKLMQQSNVTILNWVSDEELKVLYAGCKGFITTARDEDFGITPIEAMASGKPVIASNDGGYKETVIHDETGLLIDTINEHKLTKAIEHMNRELQNNPLRFQKKCLEQAFKFDTIFFVGKIRNIINNTHAK